MFPMNTTAQGKRKDRLYVEDEEEDSKDIVSNVYLGECVGSRRDATFVGGTLNFRCSPGRYKEGRGKHDSDGPKAHYARK